MIREKLLILLFLLMIALSNTMMAQTVAGSESMNIKAGTDMSFDGLLMVPNQDIELKDNAISSSSNTVQWPIFKSIGVVHQFLKPLSFVGELGLLADNDILNGNSKSNLKIAFANLSSNHYNDFSILNSSLVNGDMVLARLSSAYLLGAVTAVSREPELSEIVKAENFFTPNGDGINDYWVVQDIQLYPNNVLTIFDRAGRKVFQKNNYDNSWDGFFNGSPLAKGTYYYTLKLSNTLPIVKGFITIVR